MNVKELKTLLQYANENDEVTLYDLATGTRMSLSEGMIDFDVRDTFEINFDSNNLDW